MPFKNIGNQYYKGKQQQQQQKKKKTYILYKTADYPIYFFFNYYFLQVAYSIIASPSVLYCVALRRPRLGNDLGAASPINNPSHGHILHSCQPVT